MKTTPRKHHYIPEFYLAGFTNSGKRDDFLYVLDKKQVKQWKGTPKNAACERDFYRVDSEELESDYIENVISKFEGLAAPVLEKIIKNCTLPLPEDEAYVILTNIGQKPLPEA
jgi:hypothetical protein